MKRDRSKHLLGGRLRNCELKRDGEIRERSEKREKRKEIYPRSWSCSSRSSCPSDDIYPRSTIHLKIPRRRLVFDSRAETERLWLSLAREIDKNDGVGRTKKLKTGKLGRWNAWKTLIRRVVEATKWWGAVKRRFEIENQALGARVASCCMFNRRVSCFVSLSLRLVLIVRKKRIVVDERNVLDGATCTFSNHPPVGRRYLAYHTDKYTHAQLAATTQQRIRACSFVAINVYS